MVVVLDSSAATDLLLGLDAAPWVADQLRSARSVHAPHLVDVEVASTLRGLVRGRLVTARRAGQAIGDLRDLAVMRYPHRLLLDRVWGLRASLSAYDAVFVALAEALGATLVTTDAPQAAAAARYVATDLFRAA